MVRKWRNIDTQQVIYAYTISSIFQHWGVMVYIMFICDCTNMDKYGESII